MNSSHFRLPSTRWIIAVLFAAAVSFAVLYHLFVPGAKNEFWDNLVATVIGLIIGISIPVFLERTARKSDESIQRLKTLRLVQNEIIHNHAAVDFILAADGVTSQEMLQHRFTSEVWDALSDGGELRWINDNHLLRCISNAYSRTKPLAHLQDRYIDSRIVNDVPRFDAYLRALRESIRDSNPFIDAALDAVNEAVGEK
ncbi:MAG: hypothetical protein HY741_24605 [Chloroflexi bacterium]|nr:hypothetical protein [Chloroflexota bacterium]